MLRGTRKGRVGGLDKLGYLARINLMEELPPAALADVAAVTPMSAVSRGTVISSPDRATEVIYMLKDGHVRLYRLSPDGKEFTTALLGPGNIFGQSGEFSLGTADSFAEAVDDCILCLLTRSDLESLLERHPRLARRMVQILSSRLREAEEAMSYLALADLRARLLHLLVRLAQEFGRPEAGGWVQVATDLSHQDLAKMIGATRETISAHLSAMGREGLVRTGRKLLRINLQACQQALAEAQG